MKVADVLTTLEDYPRELPLSAPQYRYKEGPHIMLATPSQSRHTSNEGWQLALALEAGGYELCGNGLSSTDVRELLKQEPAVVFVQDQHEWDGSHLPPTAQGHLAVADEYFHESELLAQHLDVFKLTVVKDTHRQYESAKRYSRNIGCHAWVCYYHPQIVLRTLSWIRPEHLIRTWHTLDAVAVPQFNTTREPCLLSGSLGGAYPLRTRIHEANLPGVSFLKHPGYHNTGTHTTDYLRTLSDYKVSIATASKFGYCLRKIIESTACGCIVLTDLPVDEVVPHIDENLVRIEPDIDLHELGQLITELVHSWDVERQRHFAGLAKYWFDYRQEGRRLAAAIEQLRKDY